MKSINLILFILVSTVLAGAAEIHDLAEQGRLDDLRRLLHSDPALLESRDTNSATALHLAASRGHVAVVESLLDRHADLEARDQVQGTPLHRAARQGHTQVVRLLLDRKADIVARDTHGCTPLHSAVYGNHLETARLLVSRGADVDAVRTDGGGAPLHFAARGGQTELCELLIDAGANLEVRTRTELTSLHLASWNGHREITVRLLAQGADIQAQDEDGDTALHLCARRGELEIARLLLEHGADPNTRNSRGLKPVDLVDTRRQATLGALLDSQAVARSGSFGQRRVGSWGELARLAFDGLETFTAGALRDSLRINLEYHFIAHPAAPLGDYLEGLQRLLVRGLQHAGFPAPQVDAQLEEAAGRVLVRVIEGPRFRCGGVEVRGIRPEFASELTSRLLPALAGSTNEPGAVLAGTWRDGLMASFDTGAQATFRHTVTNAFAALGHFFPRFDLAIVPRAETGTADLVVTVEDPGPAAVLGEVEVVGAVKNGRDAVLRYLSLTPGMRLDREVVAEKSQLLWKSGRFLRHDLSLLPSEDSGRTKLQVHVAEHKPARPLDEDLSPEEQALLRFRDWLSAWATSDEDLVLSQEGSGGGRTFQAEAVLSPFGGVLISAQVGSAAEPTLHDYALLIAPDAQGLFLASRGRKFLHHNGGGGLWFKLGVGPSFKPEDSESVFGITIAMGFRSRSTEGGDRPPFQIELDLAPAAFLDIAYRTNALCAIRDGILTVSRANPAGPETVRIDAATGRLIAWEGNFSGNTNSPAPWWGKVRFAPGRGIFADRVQKLHQRTVTHANRCDVDHPFRSLLRFMFAELVQTPEISDWLFESVPAEKVARVAGALDGMLTAVSEAQDWETLLGKAISGEDEMLLIPPDPDSPSPAGGLSAMVAGFVLGYVLPVLPAESWPATLLREGALVTNGRGDYTTRELQQLLGSDTMGPFGFWTTAMLAGYVNPAFTAAFAQRGLQHLSTADFQKDRQLLTGTESLLSKLIRAGLEALGRTPDSDLEAVMELLPEDHTKIALELIGRIRGRQGRSMAEAIAPVLDAYWESTLRDVVDHELYALLGQANRVLLGISGRDPKAAPEAIDLSAHYNAALTEDWYSVFGNNDLTDLPRGTQVLGGVAFDVRGLIQVTAARRRGGEFPRTVEGLRVRRTYRRLHFLHAAVNAQRSRDGTQIGHYTVHYADGDQQEIPLVIGRDLADWWTPATREENSLPVVWVGSNAAGREQDRKIRLFKSTWENPRPDATIVSIDLSGDHPLAAPFVVAITAEP